ncbi:MAG: DUF488 domain-containing protein [Candidatus Bathyarchaeota archaeon]|jgi:uncharacterized protein YeaO (DUF488 family)|nr:DUF488 domain-containing protein [Candidatus Bathyarchaeota archaeon A05DMB-5]MDH7557016.1 DUF488 domain-containing protein [Candidatus Bathyarchaeota archaeon]
MIKIKRVYDAPSKEDGYRILVDRLWPRGLSKEKANVDLWLREIAPSDELRKRFCHDPVKWEEFKEKYAEELERKRDLLRKIKQIEEEQGTVTLLYAAKDKEHNNAVALSNVLKSA